MKAPYGWISRCATPEDFVVEILDRQSRGKVIVPAEHALMIQFVDDKLADMVGFKYAVRGEAFKDFIRFHQ